MDYVDFDLHIALSNSDEFPVKVKYNGRDWEGVLKMPWRAEGDLSQALTDVEAAVKEAQVHSRAVSFTEDVPRKDREEKEPPRDAGPDPVTDFGTQLFDALFSEKVKAAFDEAKKDRGQGKGIRVRLRIEPAQLVNLPWEFLRDKEDDYVCLSAGTPVVRYIKSGDVEKPLSVKPPLRILAMVSSPTDLPKLDVEEEKRRIVEATAHLAKEKLTIKWMEGSTYSALQGELRRGDFHIFHFIGHGGFDEAAKAGTLAFTGPDGTKDLVSSTDLRRLLKDEHPLRLVVLNSCLGAKGSNTHPLSSTAATLARDVPAVVAMQYEISDYAAKGFARELYSSIADGWPIDAAVAEARKAISVRGSVEWGTPVLYMRAPNGILFDLDPAAREPLPPTPVLPTPVIDDPKPSGRGRMIALAATAILVAGGGAVWMNSGAADPVDTTRSAEKSVPEKPIEAKPPTPVAVIPPAGDGMEMVKIEAGKFKMGSPNSEAGRRVNEGPVHEVNVRAFELGKYEVSVGQFKEYVDAENPSLNGCDAYEGNRWKTSSNRNWRSPGFDQSPKDPVVCVSWLDVQGYLNWLSKKGSAQPYRLPTESEWEYAARAGTVGARYWSSNDETCQYAVTAHESVICHVEAKKGTRPAGTKKPNQFNLFDILGNAWEWTEDCGNDRYTNAPVSGEAWKAGNCGVRMVRGGSWVHGLANVRAASRDGFNPRTRMNLVGFRVARNLP